MTDTACITRRFWSPAAPVTSAATRPAAGRARRARRGARQSIHRLSPGGASMRRWWSAMSAIASWSTRAARRARRRHRHALRRAHHRAGVGRESAQVLRQQHLRDAQSAASAARTPASSISCFPRPPRCTAFRPSGLAAEESPTAPINPYGTSKLMSEWMLRDLARRDRTALRGAALLQRRRLRSRGPHRPVDAARPRCWSRWPARQPSASARTSRSSAPTTRLRTAPACATTSMSRISPARTCNALDYLRARRRRR